MFVRFAPWIVWLAAVWGILKVHELKNVPSCDICGPWGCGPPIQALISIHGGWVIFLLPVAFLASLRCTDKQLKRFALVMILIGLLGIFGVGIYRSLTWLQETRPNYQQYFFQRWGFSILTLTDIPILQSLLFGMIFLCVYFAKQKTSRPEIINKPQEIET